MFQTKKITFQKCPEKSQGFGYCCNKSKLYVFGGWKGLFKDKNFSNELWSLDCMIHYILFISFIFVFN